MQKKYSKDNMIRRVRDYMIYNIPAPMDIVEKTEILKAFPLFENETVGVIQEFAKKMYPKVFHPMEVFVEEDVDQQQAFFVYKGAVSKFRTTEEGEIINIDLVGAPDLVGKMGLLDSQKSTTTDMAVVEVHALVLNQNDFELLIESHPKVALRLLKIFAGRIHQFDVFLEHLLAHNLYDRTWYLLQRLAEYFPNKEIRLSQEELTDLLWGTRSRVTEVLNQLEDEGKIKIDHRLVKLL